MMHVAPARCGCRALAGSKVQSPVRVEESAPQVHAAAKRRAGRRVKCWATVRRIREPSDGDDEGEDGRELASSPSARRRYLLQYVTDVQPSVMESFSTQASPEVLDAMRHTVTNLVGSLPPQWFAVTVSSLSENLAQLLFSTLMTGYVFRNLARRRELKRMLQQPGAGATTSKTLLSTTRGPLQQPSQQRDVSGMVVLPRSSTSEGKQLVPASAYIDDLEREVVRLREELATVKRCLAGRNELLDDLHALEPTNLAELTSSADAEVLDAMNAFVKRLVDVDAGDAGARSTTSVPELARLLSWCLIVGFALRANQEDFDVGSTLAA